MRIFILFPIASFYVSRSRETNRQIRPLASEPAPRAPDPAQSTPPATGSGSSRARDGPRSGSSFTVLRAVWRGERRARARGGGAAPNGVGRAGKPNPQQSEAASRRSVFDRVPLLSDLKLCLLRSCQAPRAAPTLPLLRFWAGWGWGCGTSGCGCGMRLEGLGVALLRSSANLIT